MNSSVYRIVEYRLLLGMVRKSILVPVSVAAIIKKMLLEICLSENKQKGISLLELLIVLVVVGVLVALAIPNFNRANTQFQRQNIARQLKIDFERARFDSVKRNAETFNEMAKLIINNPTSFSSVLDLNNNGTIETSEIHLTNISAAGAKIVGGNLIFPITVTFDRRGQARAINGSNAAITPTFVICGQDCTFATANQTNSNTLSISPSGTVALVEAGQVFFDRAVPNVTSVSTGSKINSMAQVSD